MTQKSARPDDVPSETLAALADSEFDSLCNELASLAQETAALNLPEGAAQMIEEVRKNALAQHFRIVLVSPFQGGKSTIFNTICGGRELSPTGYGIKTSAAVAEARYLEDAEQVEYAELEWRSDEELLAGMEGLVFPYLSRSDQSVEAVLKDRSQIQLSNPQDRTLLLKAVRDASQAAEFRDQAENADVLSVARLTLEHYKACVKFRQETRVPLTRATSWLAFPPDWTTRSIAEFEPEEIVFLFLKRAIFHLREPALRRLRASIIDAPGLQASRWDTAVTTDCIRQAHAVVFLLGTQARALAQAELSEFESFRRFDLSENVFYGYNARSRSLHLARERLLPNDLAQLRRAGFVIPENRVSIFNALLAYRARQYELLSEGRLPADTIQALSDKALEVLSPQELPRGGENPSENAQRLIIHEIETAYSEFTGRKIASLSIEKAREAGVESNWEDLIARASRFVIARKGEAILIDRGTRQIVKALERLDGDLQDREKAAERSAGTTQHEKEQAEAALAAFEAEVVRLQLQVEEDLERQGYKELLDELRGRLEKTGPLETAMSRIIDQTVSPRMLPTRLANEAIDFVEKASSGWQAGLTSGTSRALNRVVHEIVKPVEQRLRELARKAQAQAPGLLGGGAVVLVSEAVQVAYGDIGEIVSAMFQKSYVNKFADGAEDFLDELGLGDVISWFRGFVNRDVLGSPAAWKSRVPTTVRAVKSAAFDLADRLVEQQITGIQKEVKAEIDKAVKEVRDAYTDRLQQRQADLEKSFEEKERISRDAAARRREVSVFRQRVDDFVARVGSRLESSE